MRICCQTESDYRKLLKAVREETPDNNPLLVTIQYKKKSENVFPGETGIYTIKNDAGVFNGFIGLIRDVEERIRVRTERENLIHQLETQNAELERFAYTISHDLKSPLITIQGFLGLLKQDLLNGDQCIVDKDFERITNAVYQMELLLKDLLELSRIGHVLQPFSHHNFRELVDRALEMVATQLKEKKVKVVVNPNLPNVFCDDVRMVEVLVNLLDNSVKFMGDQTRPKVEIGHKKIKDQFQFFVKDNGIGIEKRYQEKVFELFDQLNPQMSGSGTGLTIVKRIIENHHGKIWVESEGDRTGTIFYFTLPVPELNCILSR